MIRSFMMAGLVGITLLTVTAAPPEKAKRFDKKALRNATSIHERHKNSIYSNQNIRGSGIGRRKSDNKTVIKVYSSNRDTGNIPISVDGMPVEVEYVGEITALRTKKPPRNINNRRKPLAHSVRNDSSIPSYDIQAGSIDRRDRFDRPVPIGISVGHSDVSAGTLGCRVSQGCHLFVLSNNHVLANQNDAEIGDPIIQPGSFDGGNAPADTIGLLYDYVPLNFTTSCNVNTCNRVDAAIAEVTGAYVINATTSDGYGTPRDETIEPYVGMKVMKYGRTTGLSYGYIDSLNAIVDVNFGTTSNTNYARFVSQIIIKPADDASYSDFSAGGDSGSLIVAADANYPAPDCVNDPAPCTWDYPPLGDERKPVGLLFAGGGGITVANDISDVLGAFDILIDGN